MMTEKMAKTNDVDESYMTFMTEYQRMKQEGEDAITDGMEEIAKFNEQTAASSSNAEDEQVDF